MDSRPLKVFLCHAHSDAAQVRALYSRLKADGVDAWLDKENIVAGQDWEYEIRKAVRESDIVIVCLSKQFNQKGYRQNEVRSALEEASLQPEGEIFIIPARLEECDYLESLRRFHGVDLFEERGYEYLMRALRLRAEKIGAVLQSKRSWLPNITIPRATSRKSAEIKKTESAKKKQAETPREIPNNKIQQKSETPPTANEFPDGWEAEWLPALESDKSSTKKESTEKLNPKPVVAKRAPRKWNTRMLAAIAGIVVIFAAIFGLPWNQWLSAAPDITTATPTNIVTFTHPSSTVTFTSPLSTKTNTPTPTILPTITSTPTPLPTETVDRTGIEMVLVPAGRFIMGDRGDERDVDAFYIDKYEITNKQYQECVFDNLGGCESPVGGSSSTHLNYYGLSEFENYPVIYVDWYMATAYCSWRDARLPTEPEWEKAARGEEWQMYPWGNEASCYYANYYNCKGDTTAVGTYGHNVYGVYDMAGNVEEWTSSLYMGYPYITNDGREDPDAKGARTVRGGAWDSASVWEISTSYRSGVNPFISSQKIGFRCVRSVP